MTSQKSESTSLRNSHVTSGNAGPTLTNEAQKAIVEFTTVWNARQAFFAETFIEKLRDGSKRALAELQKHSLSPTHMDLRDHLGKCIKANVPDDYVFTMASGATFSLVSLKKLVPSWASLATNALIASDPALADKLMTQVQWNAKPLHKVDSQSSEGCDCKYQNGEYPKQCTHWIRRQDIAWRSNGNRGRDGKTV
jgi:hypothetical protein